MKKTVVTILLVLPFFLMFLISFMGRIMSNYQFIYVDSVCFINSENICISDVIKLKINQTYDLNVKVYPELATNKKVIYSSLNESIIYIDQKGIITAKDYGITKVSVKTEDGNKRAELLIKVSDDNVSGVNIVEENLEINIKDEYTLNVVINPYTAINKKVSWSSTNSNIATVDVNGKITGIKEGKATITVTTEDGNFIDECFVKVNGFNKPFDVVEYEEGKAIYTIDHDYYDLTKLVIVYDKEKIKIENIKYTIILNQSNDSNKAYIEGNHLIIKENVIVRILIEVEGIDYKPTIFVRYIK